MFLKRLRRKRLLAFTLIEVMAVTGIISTLQAQSGSTYRYAMDRARELNGVNNLRQIYMLLQAQTMGQGLPKAALYPKGDPLTDPQSIVKLIEGAPRELFISPFAPEIFRTKGLTYVWNDTVNGKELDLVPKGTWLLIDMAAFIADPNIPKPPKYLVLYADGRAEAIAQLPEDISKAVDEAQKKLQEQEAETTK